MWYFIHCKINHYTEFPIPLWREVFWNMFRELLQLWNATAASYCPSRAGDSLKIILTTSLIDWMGNHVLHYVICVLQHDVKILSIVLTYMNTIDLSTNFARSYVTPRFGSFACTCLPIWIAGITVSRCIMLEIQGRWVGGPAK